MVAGGAHGPLVPKAQEAGAQLPPLAPAQLQKGVRTKEQRHPPLGAQPRVRPRPFLVLQRVLVMRSSIRIAKDALLAPPMPRRTLPTTRPAPVPIAVAKTVKIRASTTSATPPLPPALPAPPTHPQEMSAKVGPRSGAPRRPQGAGAVTRPVRPRGVPHAVLPADRSRLRPLPTPIRPRGEQARRPKAQAAPATLLRRRRGRQRVRTPNNTQPRPEGVEDGPTAGTRPACRASSPLVPPDAAAKPSRLPPLPKPTRAGATPAGAPVPGTGAASARPHAPRGRQPVAAKLGARVTSLPPRTAAEKP